MIKRVINDMNHSNAEKNADESEGNKRHIFVPSRLPPEVWDKICYRLEFQDFTSLRVTCKCVYRTFSDYISWTSKPLGLQRLLVTACKHGKLEYIRLLLDKAGFDPTFDNHRIIMETVTRWQSGAMALLLQDTRLDPTISNHLALQSACGSGDMNMTKLLLGDKRMDPTAHEQAALKLAVLGKHTAIVKLLLEDRRVDPTVNIHHTLFRSIQLDAADIVALLIEDPRINSTHISTALNDAIQNGNTTIVQCISRNSRVQLSNQVKLEAIQTAANLGFDEIVRVMNSIPNADLRE